MTLSFTAHWHDELPGFYTALKPTPLQNARLIWHNDALADSLGIPSTLFQPEKGAGVWGGETLLPGMKPLAQVYSGHQFGVWAGQLGDGRGILLGEQLLPNGETLDWHLKGAGLTPYSRMGDGRAVLRSTIREGLASEAMHAPGSLPHARCPLSPATRRWPVKRWSRERCWSALRKAICVSVILNTSTIAASRIRSASLPITPFAVTGRTCKTSRTAMFSGSVILSRALPQ